MVVVLNVEWNEIEKRYELVNNCIEGFRQVLATSLNSERLVKGVFEA